jgi:peptidoglycan/LPS O-acetylase OafA/YrhL
VQGLRAVAVVLVILAHAKLAHFTGGFVGVDVFFVISGFVITGLLIREEELRIRHKLLTFYTRRIRRIMPAATLTLLVTLWMTYHWLGLFAGRTLGTDARWASLFSANWRFIDVKTNYFASQQPPSVILHFWSLAVEEQFYFVFPIFVFLIWALCAGVRRRRTLLYCLVVIIATSATWCAYQTHVDPISAYYSPFTRVWELGLGAFTLLLPESVRVPHRVMNSLISWIAFAAILAAAVLFTDTTSYPGTAVWWPVGATALVLWAGKSRSGAGAEWLLARQPAKFVGDLSYSLYLWHYPILMIPMQFAVTDSISTGSRMELIAIAFAVAIVSYYLVENPIRRSKRLAQSAILTFAMALGLIASVWLAAALLQHFATV